MSVRWRVESWSRELGRGTLYEERLGSVPFDSAVADVDDFTIGEDVLVELDPALGEMRVKWVRPYIPRFRETPAGAAVPSARPEIVEQASRVLRELPFGTGERSYGEVERVSELSGGTLTVEGSYEGTYGARVEYRIALTGLLYVEMPARWETKLVRLSTENERAYLATRFESYDEPFLGITWITSSDQFVFAVGSSLQRLL